MQESFGTSGTFADSRRLLELVKDDSIFSDMCLITNFSFETCRSVNPTARRPQGSRFSGDVVQPTSSAPPPPEIRKEVGCPLKSRCCRSRSWAEEA